MHFIDKIKQLFCHILSGLQPLFNSLLSRVKLLSFKQRLLGGSVFSGVLAAILIFAFAFAGPAQNEPIEIEISPGLAAKADLEALDINTDVPLRELYAIVADGKDIICMESYEEAEEVLFGIKAKYKTAGSEITDFKFKETVSIEKREFYYPPPYFSVPDAVSYIASGATEPKIHIIAGGDNLWDIARANGIKLSELEEMNPGLNPRRLRIGMEINLYQVQPFITVYFTEVVTKTDRVAYDVIYEDDESMYRGQVQVTSPGEYGSMEIVMEITKENGVAVDSVILSETIIEEPVAQIALRGTMPAPVYTGASSEYLISPVAVIDVTSSYGSRGGRHHNGVDLKAPRGTPLYAAADGVVTYAGYSGSYGNIVKISHGDGLETYYAHCDTMLVSVGEVVTQGQQIATVGRTGNATCDHVHFEVKVNGAPKNPMNYI